MKVEMAATRANLIAAKETLAMAQEGYDLLSQKREVLLTELLHLVNDVRRVQADVASAISEAYTTLRRTLALVGPDGAHRLIQGCRRLRADVTVQERSVMGVPIPLLQLTLSPLHPIWGLGETPALLDELVQQFHRLVCLLAEQAEIETTVRRLARELSRTQLRTNALEHVIIPQYQDTVKFIQDTMEEREREEHFVLKRLKAGRGE
ncbi:MAG: V-type ATP synthase subunit D [Nitrospirae bacterium]|nr:MAG: V-type ATP synthase subunit D [Nitrospirota bacterium]